MGAITVAVKKSDFWQKSDFWNTHHFFVAKGRMAHAKPLRAPRFSAETLRLGVSFATGASIYQSQSRSAKTENEPRLLSI
ncbi:MAG: hypothetical protein R2911_25180 [Caldilineaceae bacterium]